MVNANQNLCISSMNQCFTKSQISSHTVLAFRGPTPRQHLVEKIDFEVVTVVAAIDINGNIKAVHTSRNEINVEEFIKLTASVPAGFESAASDPLC